MYRSYPALALESPHIYRCILGKVLGIFLESSWQACGEFWRVSLPFGGSSCSCLRSLLTSWWLLLAVWRLRLVSRWVDLRWSIVLNAWSGSSLRYFLGWHLSASSCWAFWLVRCCSTSSLEKIWHSMYVRLPGKNKSIKKQINQ